MALTLLSWFGLNIPITSPSPSPPPSFPEMLWGTVARRSFFSPKGPAGAIPCACRRHRRTLGFHQGWCPTARNMEELIRFDLCWYDKNGLKDIESWSWGTLLRLEIQGHPNLGGKLPFEAQVPETSGLWEQTTNGAYWSPAKIWGSQISTEKVKRYTLPVAPSKFHQLSER